MVPRSREERSAICLLTLSIMVTVMMPVSTAGGRETGKRVTVLYVGDTGFQTWRDMDGDPLLAVTLPACGTSRPITYAALLDRSHKKTHEAVYPPHLREVLVGCGPADTE